MGDILGVDIIDETCRGDEHGRTTVLLKDAVFDMVPPDAFSNAIGFSNDWIAFTLELWRKMDSRPSLSPWRWGRD